MIDQPRATIATVIALYRGCETIDETIASVRAQSLQPDELILIDDGSGDATLETALRATDGAAFTVRSITQENGGQSAARNAGVALTQCDFIALLDQDDLWHRDHLRLLLETAQKRDDIGWTYSDFNQIDRDGRMVIRNFRRFTDSPQANRSLHEILSHDVFALPSASLIRREAFAAAGGFDPRLRGYEDDDLFMRIFSAGWTSAYLREALVDYRRHDGGSSGDRTFWRSRVIFYTAMRDAYADNGVDGRDVIDDILRPRLVASTKRDYARALRKNQFDDARDITNTFEGLFPDGRVGVRRKAALALLRHPRLARRVLLLWQQTPGLRRWLSPELRLRS